MRLASASSEFKADRAWVRDIRAVLPPGISNSVTSSHPLGPPPAQARFCLARPECACWFAIGACCCRGSAATVAAAELDQTNRVSESGRLASGGGAVPPSSPKQRHNPSHRRRQQRRLARFGARARGGAKIEKTLAISVAWVVARWDERARVATAPRTVRAAGHSSGGVEDLNIDSALGEVASK